MLTFFIDIPCVDDEVIRSCDILYIRLIYKNKAPKLEIHTLSKEYSPKISGSIDALEILFSKFGFVRIDSGVLANLNHFSHFDKTALGDIFLHFTESNKKVLCSRGGHLKAKKIIDEKSSGE